MNNSLKDIRLVIIDIPLNSTEDDFTTSLLWKAFGIKYRGYTATYDDTVLPFDKTDFFGTHIMLCDVSGDNYTPIVIYKSVSYDRCLKYRVEFPPLTLIKSGGSSDCEKAITQILSSVSDPSTISYDSAWAQNVNYRFSQDRQLKETLREITMMMAVAHHQEFNIPHMMCAGMVKVKTVTFFEELGLKAVHPNSLFQYHYSQPEAAHMFYNNTFSSTAHEMYQKHKMLWEKRLVITEKITEKKIAA